MRQRHPRGSSIDVHELDPKWDGIGSQPRSITFGLLFLLYVIYAAFKPLDASDDHPLFHIKRGVKYGCIFFLSFCATQLRDGHFLRPHPVIWRVVTGIFILYEMILIVLLFQSGQGAPKMMQVLDSSLGVALPSKSYGEDCRIFTPEDPYSYIRNVHDTALDVFVPMHFFGWFIGALMIRDYIFCWFLSVFFEFYELSFAHWLPNFNECWWDHIFFDIFICNALGIHLGMKMCRFFEMKKYNWVGITQIPNLRGKAHRAMQQFTPMNWLPYDWEMFQSANRFWRVVFMFFSLSVMMLNSFFLKAVLWIPAENILNVIRLLIWYSNGSYAVAEYYIFCASPPRSAGARKVGPRVWLALCVVVTEVMVIVKFNAGQFSAPFPAYVRWSWSIGVLLLVFGSTAYFWCIKSYKKKSSPRNQALKKSTKVL